MAYIGAFLYFLTFLQIERGVMNLIYLNLFSTINMCYLWAGIAQSV
jgi:hypothetical protein